MSDWIMARLDALRERVERATPGPWENYGDGDHEVYQAGEYDDGDLGPYIARSVPAEDDAVFIAAARTDVERIEAALRAVLDLHVPHEWYNGEVLCLECDDNTGMFRDYPCGTVRAITDALGGDDDDMG